MDVGIGDRHHHQDVRDRSIGRVPLSTVDDPLITIANRRALKKARVAAGGVRFGH